MSDMRLMQTFYGIHTDDWTTTFGRFRSTSTYAGTNKILVKEYISDGCTTTDSSVATNSHSFLFPHHIAKTYFIEGVIEGHVTFGSSTGTAYLCSYRVSVCKTNINDTSSSSIVVLFSTGWVDVDKTFSWDTSIVTTGIGEEVVFPFWIDAWEHEKLDEEERLYVQVESTCSINSSCTGCLASSCGSAILYHSNDATWEDLKITIPFMGI